MASDNNDDDVNEWDTPFFSHDLFHGTSNLQWMVPLNASVLGKLMIHYALVSVFVPLGSHGLSHIERFLSTYKQRRDEMPQNRKIRWSGLYCGNNASIHLKNSLTAAFTLNNKDAWSPYLSQPLLFHHNATSTLFARSVPKIRDSEQEKSTINNGWPPNGKCWCGGS